MALYTLMSSSEYRDHTGTKPLLEVETVVLASAPSPCTRYAKASIAAVVLIVMLFLLWALRSNVVYGKSDEVCGEPTVRREWRTLSSLERLEYLRAVKCLSQIPSSVCNGTLHDEFAYIHRKIGDYCTQRHLLLPDATFLTFKAHEAAPFLPWHRYFIHIYVESLKQRCQYERSFP
jgi:hypothetical protein